MSGTILDGGCVLHEFPGRHELEVAPPKVWRPMSEEERLLALGFCSVPPLFQHDALARAMFHKARTNGKITDKQGRAIHAIARAYGISSDEGATLVVFGAGVRIHGPKANWHNCAARRALDRIADRVPPLRRVAVEITGRRGRVINPLENPPM